jgi:hypothetical protein
MAHTGPCWHGCTCTCPFCCPTAASHKTCQALRKRPPHRAGAAAEPWVLPWYVRARKHAHRLTLGDKDAIPLKGRCCQISVSHVFKIFLSRAYVVLPDGAQRNPLCSQTIFHDISPPQHSAHLFILTIQLYRHSHLCIY